MPRPLGQTPDVFASARDTTVYAQDYYAWTQDQVALLRAGQREQLDLKNLAEEVGDLGISVKREIASRLNVLLSHLLKWHHQPARRSNSWKATIVEQRRRILNDLAASPSLKDYPAAIVDQEYDSARLRASGETGLPEGAFPRDCPFAVAGILDPDFFPETEE